MTANKAELRFAEFSRALSRLQEVVARQSPTDDMLRDAMVQRFEFTFEIAWKTLKAFLEIRGKDAPFALDSLKGAFRAGWIDDEKFWTGMMKDRNLTSHTYKEEMAAEIAERIPGYAEAMQVLHGRLADVLKE